MKGCTVVSGIPPNPKRQGRGFDRAVHGAGEYNQLRKVRTHRSEDAPQGEAEGMTLLDVPVRIVVVVVDGMRICSARLVTGCIDGLFRLHLTGLWCLSGCQGFDVQERKGLARGECWGQLTIDDDG